jgi:hypothetical protein
VSPFYSGKQKLVDTSGRVGQIQQKVRPENKRRKLPALYVRVYFFARTRYNEHTIAAGGYSDGHSANSRLKALWAIFSS